MLTSGRWQESWSWALLWSLAAVETNRETAGIIGGRRWQHELARCKSVLQPATGPLWEVCAALDPVTLQHLLVMELFRKYLLGVYVAFGIYSLGAWHGISLKVHLWWSTGTQATFFRFVKLWNHVKPWAEADALTGGSDWCTFEWFYPSVLDGHGFCGLSLSFGTKLASKFAQCGHLNWPGAIHAAVWLHFWWRDNPNWFGQDLKIFAAWQSYGPTQRLRILLF